MPGIIDEIHPLIVRLRRGIETTQSWERFRALVEREIDRICRELNTRQLVSICDTFVDHGDPVESRNAMFVTLLADLEKTSQSYLLWRLNYEAPFDVPEENKPRKVKLWDGMTSFHLEIGDVTNSFFRRLDHLMAPTAAIKRIYEIVIDRMKDHPTILGTLNKSHQHVFDVDTRWRREGAYDRFRHSGEIPPWKTDF